MMASSKKNFAYNLTLTISNNILPLLTYPYVSRILGVTNIGICNYVDSIINYLVLIAALGIGSFGVREIARCKDDIASCNRVFSSLIGINVVLTVASIAILFILAFYIPIFEPYRKFLGIGVCKLIFSAFLIEWFFQGISNFKYITIRSIITKCIYIVCIFIFIKSEEDTLTYYLLTCLATSLNALFNWFYSQKFVKFSIKNIHISAYIKPILNFGTYRMLTSMYTTFNMFFLGFTCNDEEVGYFSTSTKLYGILMSVFTALTTVMVPKVSMLLKNGDSVQLNRIAQQTFKLIFTFTIPMIIVSLFYAPFIINIIAGPGYDGSILPFRIVMSLLLIIALEQIIIQQFLMACKKTRYIIYLSATGALTGVFLNILITPSLAAIGSSISWTVSELAILCLAIYFFKEEFTQITFPVRMIVKSIIIAIPYIPICICFSDSEFSLTAILGLLLCMAWFISSNLLYGDSNIVHIFKKYKTHVSL